MSGLAIDDLSPIASLSSLTHLAIDGIPGIDLAPLSRMTALRRLQLSAGTDYDLAPLAGSAIEILRE